MKTVRNAIKILNTFTADKPERSLTEVSRIVGIDKVIVHRQLKTMKEMDLVEQDIDTKRYRLGVGIAKLAAVRRSHIRPLNFASERLLQVRSEIDETVNLSQLEGDLIFVTNVSLCTSDLRVVMAVGEMLPAYCTAPGLLFLSFGNAHFRNMALSGRLRPRASHTITDRDKIENLLPAIKKDGIAVVDQTYSDQAKGIAAPIFNARGEIIAAVTVLGPSFRLHGKIEERAKTLIKQAASNFSKDQGYDPEIVNFDGPVKLENDERRNQDDRA